MRLFGAVAVALVVAACGADPPPSLIREVHPATIAGTSWRVVAVGGQPVPDRPAITVDFGEGGLRGAGPCNAIAGGVAYDGSSGAIRIGQLVTTKRACIDPSLARLETSLVAALRSSTSIGVDSEGRLVLAGSGSDVILVVAGQPVGQPATSASS
jgi:heat shock protein HslJ